MLRPLLNSVQYALLLRPTCFERKLGEQFEFSRNICDTYTSYSSNSYLFYVTASFIQARIQEDFLTPIEKRIDDVFKEENIEKNTLYQLASKKVSSAIPMEYYIEKLEGKTKSYKHGIPKRLYALSIAG